MIHPTQSTPQQLPTNEQLEPTSGRRRLRVVSRTVTSSAPFVVSWIVTIALFFPGHANGDTAGPYLYALGRLPIDDWHPTANVALNWLMLQLWESPASIVALQAGLFWFGMGVISNTVGRAFRVHATPFFLVAGFTPIVFGYLGTLIKDTYSMAFTIAAIALLTVERVTARHQRLLLLSASAMLIPAFLVKFSALPIVLALFVYTALRLGLHRGTKSAVLVAIPLTAVFLLVLVSTQRVVDSATHARKAHIESSLELYDLTGIAHFSGDNVLGRSILPDDQVGRVTAGDCYDPHGWDVLAWGSCSFVWANTEPVWGSKRFASQWRDAILEHPVAYVEHRASHLWAFSTSAGRYGFYYDYVDGRMDWQPNHNSIMDAYDVVIETTADWPFARPVFWQIASAALLICVLSPPRRRRPGVFDPLIAAMSIGNLLFYAAWAVIGVSDEFRYSYSVVVNCVIGALILVLEVQGRRKCRQRSGSSTVDPERSAIEASEPKPGAAFLSLPPVTSA